MIARLVALVAALGALVLLAEGARVWLAETRGRAPVAPVEEPSLGPYVRHVDPRVGYVLAPSTSFALLESTVTTDAHGMRRRAGGAPPDDARVVLVVGDSVAFGFGVDDDECLAHALETLLDDPAVRGADGRRVVCRTVAVPSWNHASPLAYLRHEIERLAPDVVLYLPVHNDLADTSGVTSLGTRREEPVVTSPTPLVEVALGRAGDLERAARAQAGLRGEPLDDDELGVDALESDVAATSRRRYAAAVDSIVALRDLAARHGARFALLMTGAADFGRLVRARLVERGGDVAELAAGAIPLLQSTVARFTLGYDPHPNAATLAVWAGWIGRDLAARGWVDARDDASWPEVPDDYARHRRVVAPDEALVAGAAAHRSSTAAAFATEIDFATGRGVRQVLGGINANGYARTGLRVAVARPEGDATLLVLAAPLRGRHDLYPLDVDVLWRGEPVGTFTIPPDDVGRFRLDLPPRSPGPLERVAEVELRPRDWVVASVDARRLVASFLPLRIAVVPR